MDQQTLKPAPDDKTTFTLYRFCLSRRLALSDQERSVQGIELSKVARQRQLPLIRVRERIGRLWIKSRLYPEAFLNEWLARYRQAQTKATAAAERSPEPQPAQPTADSRGVPSSSGQAASKRARSAPLARGAEKTARGEHHA